MVKGAPTATSASSSSSAPATAPRSRARPSTSASGSRTPSRSSCPPDDLGDVPPDSKGTHAHPELAPTRRCSARPRRRFALSPAGALRRQGRPLPRREHSAQGRQGRQGQGQSRQQDGIRSSKIIGRRAQKVRPEAPQAPHRPRSPARRAPAAQRVPQRAAHLRAGRRRRGRQDARRRLHAVAGPEGHARRGQRRPTRRRRSAP